MPPIRSHVAPKSTPRTHEENQERAYIAASRRSDRSIEARVESARRASEVHKKRTGRSLRVTEADVENDEMYEEIDDDLPPAYRRMTQQCNPADPNLHAKLQAFLTSNVAIRSALNQAMAASYYHSPQGHAPPQFAPIHYQAYNGQQAFAPQGQAPGQMIQPMHSPHWQQNIPLRPHPYQQSHGRHNSIATPRELDHSRRSSATSPLASPGHMRRMSVPNAPPTPASTIASPEMDNRRQHPAFPQGTFQSMTPGQMPEDPNYNVYNFAPLTASLPQNTQQLVAASYDTTMTGSQQYLPQGFYPYVPAPSAGGNSNNKTSSGPSLEGLSSTLSPSSNQDLCENFNLMSPGPPAYSEFDTTNYSLGDGSVMNTPNGEMPGGNEWEFINSESWEMPNEGETPTSCTLSADVITDMIDHFRG